MEKSRNKTEYEQIKDFILLCLKNWHYFVISMFICGVIGVLHYVFATPVYKIASQVSIRHDESIVGGGTTGGSSVLSAFGFGGGGGENVEDETLKLASQGYVKNVVKKLDLNKGYTQTELFGFKKTALYEKSPLVLSVDEAVSDSIYKRLKFNLKIKPERTSVKLKIGFKTLRTYDITSFPATLETPYGQFTLSKSPYFDDYEYPMNMSVLYGNYDFWAQIYKKGLVVDFEKKTSDIIHLSMDSESISFTKMLLSGIIDHYNEEWDADKNRVSEKTIEFIDERLHVVMNDLSSADKKIQEFKNRYNLTEIEADVTYYLTKSGEIQAALLDAENQFNLVDLIVTFVNDPVNKYALIPFTPTTDNAAFQEIINKYNEELIKRNEMMSKNTIQSPVTSALDRAIDLQRDNLLKSLDNIKEGLKLTVNNIKKKERELNSKIGNVPEIERDYVQLKREQELQQGVYIFLLEMREQAGVRGITLLPKLKIIDEPYVINKPVSPSLMKTALMILFFGGIVFPFGLIFGLPYLSTLRKRKKK